MGYDWKLTLLGLNASIKEVSQSLIKSSLRIVLVVDDKQTLLGTATDGDIRRGFLRGLSLDSSVTEVMRKKPLVVPAGMAESAIRELMYANNIQQIPEVDSLNRVIHLHTWNDFSSHERLKNKFVIMAGGEGKRLRPLTEICPKPMLQIRQKPMLQHIIERAKGEGFDDFIISINYLGDIIQDYFGDGSEFGVNIGYVREKEALGTAGSLSMILDRVDEPVMVTNGDVMTDIKYRDFLDFHMRHDAMATMAVKLHEWEHPYGVVNMNGLEIVGFEEKPVSKSHINAGIYVLEKEGLNFLEKERHMDMPELFARIRDGGHFTLAYPMHEPWLDVGRPDDLKRINADSIPTKASPTL